MSVLKFLLAAQLCVSMVSAWGPEGHAIVAQLATNFISDATKAKIATFLGGQTLASISSIPDAYRATPQGSWSGPLHYVDAMQGQNEIIMNKDCPNGICVVNAIYNYTTRLVKDSRKPFACNLSTSVEPCALVFLTHFVGDAHQPLHAGWGSDEGGNTVQVTFFGTSTNLHAVWDTYIIGRWNSDYLSATQELLARVKTNPTYATQFLNTTNALLMADESFMWVRDTVYAFNGTKEAPDAVIPLGLDYYNANLPVVQNRLMAAGVRLGKMLEETLSLSPMGSFNTVVRRIMELRKTFDVSRVRSI